MLYLSWNMARLIRLTDFRFYSMVKFCLQRSLWSLQETHSLRVRSQNVIEVKRLFRCWDNFDGRLCDVRD